MFPLSAHNYFEITALLTSIIFWAKIRNTRFRWLPLFLIFMVTVEFYGRYLRNVARQPNAWLYNYSIPVEYLFYAMLFYLHCQKRHFKSIILGFIVFFILFVVINFIFIQGGPKMNTNLVKVGSFSMIILSCLVFIELLSTDKPINFLKEPMFWLATGVLLFNAGEFFYSLFSDYLIKNHLDRTRKIFKSINNKLIWVLFTCIIISLLCIRKKPQRV